MKKNKSKKKIKVPVVLATLTLVVLCCLVIYYIFVNATDKATLPQGPSIAEENGINGVSK